jgi:hypothetical protein
VSEAATTAPEEVAPSSTMPEVDLSEPIERIVTDDVLVEIAGRGSISAIAGDTLTIEDGKVTKIKLTNGKTITISDFEVDNPQTQPVVVMQESPEKEAAAPAPKATTAPKATGGATTTK